MGTTSTRRCGGSSRGRSRRTGSCSSPTRSPSRARATAGRCSAGSRARVAGGGRTMLGGLACEVREGRATVQGTQTLAGSVIALDTAVRNLASGAVPLAAAVAAASGNPAALLGAGDRGRIEPGRRAHLVELDDELRVRRVT